jgi:hypothetical protein
MGVRARRDRLRDRRRFKGKQRGGHSMMALGVCLIIAGGGTTLRYKLPVVVFAAIAAFGLGVAILGWILARSAGAALAALEQSESEPPSLT